MSEKENLRLKLSDLGNAIRAKSPGGGLPC